MYNKYVININIMPRGKGTYGSKKGRPPKKKKGGKLKDMIAMIFTPKMGKKKKNLK